MNIRITTIPHKHQRYPTVGDWKFSADGVLEITVSELGDWRMEALVAVHELAEVLLCKQAGVKPEDVDAFDIAFEKAREPDNTAEPGDDPKAPYVKQHCIATGIERVLAAELGVSWQEYEQKINALP